MIVLFGLLLALQSDDEFLAGYATAILERDFDGRGKVEVHDGVLTLRADSLKDQDREKARAALSRIKGVKRVVVFDGDAELPAAPASGGGWTMLPEERLFEPLLADPRWPRFSVSYGFFLRSDVPELRNTASISLGEQLTIVGLDAGSAGKFDLGLQPAVFGLFNLDAASKDLVNADYRLVIPIDYRNRWFSAQASVYHESSHLGDEFLLDTPSQRLNISYEAAQLRLSGEYGALRLYVGAERILHTFTPLEPWTAQQGIELVSPTLLLNDSMRPLIAADIQENQETAWRPSVSIRAGIELASPERSRRRVQLLLEYYRGDNPNGQFTASRVESVGVGLHVYF